MSANPEKSEASQIELQHDASLMISLLAGTEAACANNSVNIKVSLIIPVYNTDKYLPQCLESAINQTLKEIEIIVIDDASTDDSLQIIRHYESLDDRIKVIAFAENQGNGFGRNEAIRQAKGEYIMFLDSDDWLELNAAELCYLKAGFDQHDIVIYGHTSHYIDIRKDKTYTMECLPALSDNDPNVFRYLMQQRKNLSCMPWQYFIKKNIILSNEIIFIEGIYYEDVIFTIQAIYFAKTIGIIKQSLYHYRRRDGSITLSHSKKKIADMFTSLGIVKRFLEDEGIFNEHQREYLIRFLMHGVCYNFIEYFKLSGNYRDAELNNYMYTLRKSKIFRHENLLLLRLAISELGNDETRSKFFYLECEKFLSGLMYGYHIVWFNYKISHLILQLQRLKHRIIN